MGKESVTDVQDVWQDLLSLLSSLGYENLAPESTAKSLGVDSLDAIEILKNMEEAFRVTLPDDFIGPEDTLLSLAYKLKEKVEWRESSQTP